ncbi:MULTISPECIES: Asp23/Gls24 family envelope stress response protein [Aerococcus]|uniref:Asp23/Gls24 family envelope stress response protein n=1 Tax=Aerococcus sanguinicola TaxID=119206 RepID=A0A5N1GQ05_9LACT|nr:MULTISPECIES: Asp23/Gls24 family envelope stress response protein [Aerococcus]KAA9300800.1 Asp23/Gls24 family envelope stress response protein [Aerococcus sanguinicola]MDK6369412.1 Asp23/Gls24 family envelope stress response protein [Aerococcus sp. UMB9870]MDK6679914.1 Asp23/Gls24 family envelope stress response protein [Aerococcus sp. UMB8608]MDK6686725.1 Asp23/Gls24 family envelope stress response protein [Aerococcus sp. UMB8623]MDK6939836.1 Asp23/Gls24 family envelope stress response pro
MTVKMEAKHGEIEISDEAIAMVVGKATTQNYGVVGMASKNQIRDGIQEILNRENYARGVVVHSEDERVVVDVYIIVNYGTKISEICRNVQSSVKFELEKVLGLSANVVNVFVQGIRTDVD